MIKAIYPGSFDPITNGHTDVIQRASKIFDQVIIAVSQNINKKSFLSEKEKVEAINLATEGLNNVEIIVFNSLLVDFAKANNAQIILRGLRAVSDFEYEFQLAGMNKHLDKNIETFFVTPSEEFSNISSSLVKEILMLGGDISSFVPKNVEKLLFDKLK